MDVMAVKEAGAVEALVVVGDERCDGGEHRQRAQDARAVGGVLARAGAGEALAGQLVQ